MYIYKAFGLIIESDFAIRQMLPYSGEEHLSARQTFSAVPAVPPDAQAPAVPSDAHAPAVPPDAQAPAAQPDLRITSGPTPSSLVAAPIIDIPTLKVSRTAMWMEIPEIGRFYTANGTEARVERLFAPSEDKESELQVYLTGSCMGAILHERGLVPLHGSCIEQNGRGLLLTGVSGAGKSTLSAEALRNGWKMLSDDITPVFLKDGNVWAEPSFPQQKLWDDAIVRSGNEARADRRIYDFEDRTKYAVDVRDSFSKKTAVLSAVVQLIPKEEEWDGRPFIEPVQGIERAILLREHTYRTYLLADVADKQEHFRKCAVFAGHLKMAHIFRYRGVSEETLWAGAEKWFNEAEN